MPRPRAAKASSTTSMVDVRFGFVKMASKLVKLRQDTPVCASFLENSPGMMFRKLDCLEISMT